MLLCMFNMGYSQTPGCNDFTTYTWQPSGDTLGYTQGGVYPIMNVPYFGSGSVSAWDFTQTNSHPGMFGGTSGVNFSFDGSNQVITYEIYGFYNQFNQMGFSVNGSSATAMNGSFPVTIAGITVNLDTSATNFSNWENVYLSFSGNVNEIEIYAFESGVIEMCIEPLSASAISEDSNLYDITVYPNPAADILTIENKSNPEQKTTLSLMNVQGQKILCDEIDFTKTHTLDISSLSNGVYILTLNNNKMNYVSRIVIEK